MIVIHSPAVNHPPRFGQAEEQFAIEQLVAKSAIERFNVSVFPGTPLGDKQRLHFRLGQPTTNDPGHKLGPIVASQVTRAAAYREQILKYLHHLISGERSTRFDCQTFSSVFVDHRQQLQLTTVLRAVRQEIV